jgi:hypothetical protein
MLLRSFENDSEYLFLVIGVEVQITTVRIMMFQVIRSNIKIRQHFYVSNVESVNVIVYF